MPELPEVETVRRGLEPAMAGAKILRVDQRRKDLRFPFPPDFAERLCGRTILGLGRRAKYLQAELDNGEVLVMHLGMSGSFRVEQETASLTPGQFHHERSKNAAHDHVVLGLSTGCDIVYNDPRRFGFMDIIRGENIAGHPLFRNIGIEPLGNQLDANFLADAFAGKKTSIKSALLDQTIICGLGNIYVCESLHRAGISPKRAAGVLSKRNGSPSQQAIALAPVIRDVLTEAIAAGGSSLRDHRQADGTLGYFQHNFRVYDREGEACSKRGCTGHIRRIVQSGRSTFYCTRCQR